MKHVTYMTFYVKRILIVLFYLGDSGAKISVVKRLEKLQRKAFIQVLVATDVARAEASMLDNVE